MWWRKRSNKSERAGGKRKHIAREVLQKLASLLRRAGSSAMTAFATIARRVDRWWREQSDKKSSYRQTGTTSNSGLLFEKY